MRDRIDGVQRKPSWLSIAVGVLGLVLVFPSVALVTPDKSVNAGIETPYLRSESILIFSWAALTTAILSTAILSGVRFPLVREKFLPAIYSGNGRLEN
jgi:hypothetical protein